MSIDLAELSSNIWNEINKKGNAVKGYTGTYITKGNSKVSNILIFLDESEDLHLVIGVKNLSEEDMPDPNVNGLTLGVNKYRFQDLGTQKFIDLRCTHKAYKEEFTELIREISEKILFNDEPPHRTVIEVIDSWKTFWAVRSKEVLSDERQIGLLCELKVLTHLCRFDKAKALDSWKGPKGEAYDFVLTDRVLEVKGTRSGGRSHIINGLDQLTSPKNKQLLFISYLASKTNNESSISLPDIIANIERDELNNKPILIKKFRDLLACTGYNPIHKKQYKKIKFDVYDGQILVVDEDFPRITPNSLNKPLSSRIKEINYQVDIKGLASSSINGYKWFD